MLDAFWYAETFIKCQQQNILNSGGSDIHSIPTEAFLFHQYMLDFEKKNEICFKNCTDELIFLHFVKKSKSKEPTKSICDIQYHMIWMSSLI